MKLTKEFIFRILIYILGVFFLAFSVAFAVNSDLGISPVNSLPNAISLVTGVKLGTIVTIVFCCYVFIQILIKQKNFKWYDFFQLAVSFLFGYFTDFAKRVLGNFCIGGPSLAVGSFCIGLGQLAMICISMVLISIGISLYVDTRLITMPSEGLTQVFSEVFRIQFHNMKIIQDCITVGLAIAIGFIFLHRFAGVGIGTVLSAVCVGKIIGFLQKWIKPAVNRLCFPEEYKQG